MTVGQVFESFGEPFRYLTQQRLAKALRNAGWTRARGRDADERLEARAGLEPA